MNRLKASLKQIQKLESLYFLEFDFYGETIFITEINNNMEFEKGKEYYLFFQEDHIEVIKDFNIYSTFSNQLKASLLSYKEGELLTLLQCAVNGVIFQVVVRTKNFYRLHVRIGDSVVLVLPEQDVVIKDI